MLIFEQDIKLFSSSPVILENTANLSHQISEAATSLLSAECAIRNEGGTEIGEY